MHRHLACALISFACLLAAAKGWAEEPVYLDDDKFALDFSAKLTDLVKQGKCLKSEELQQRLAHGKCRVAWKVPGARAMTPQEVYQHALASVFVLGSVEQVPDHPGQWQEGRLATAWALTEDGVMATNFHVFDKMTTEGFAVANSKGEVFPVIDALGSDPAADIAVIRAAGKGFAPLPLAADEKVGAWVGALSHPGGQFFTFTQGHVTRYTKNPLGGKTQQWMSITTDFAYGSSGAPVLNRFGAVVGMAAFTTNLDFPAEDLGPEPPKDKEGRPGRPKPPGKPSQKLTQKGAPKPPAKAPGAAQEPADDEAPPVEGSLLQMIVKLAVPGKAIQEFCSEGPAAEPAAKPH